MSEELLHHHETASTENQLTSRSVTKLLREQIELGKMLQARSEFHELEEAQFSLLLEPFTEDSIPGLSEEILPAFEVILHNPYALRTLTNRFSLKHVSKDSTIQLPFTDIDPFQHLTAPEQEAAARCYSYLMQLQETESERASEVLTSLEGILRNQEHFFEYYGIFIKAEQLLGEIAPSIIPILKKIVPNLVLLHPNNPTIQKRVQTSQLSSRKIVPRSTEKKRIRDRGLSASLYSLDWGYKRCGKLHCIRVDDTWQPFNEETGTALKTVVCCHEMIHAVFTYLLNPNESTETRPENYQYPAANLGRTLHEAVSLAFEHELLRFLKSSTDTSRSDLEQLTRYGTERLKELQTSHMFLRENFRRIMTPDGEKTLPTQNFGIISYADGTRLARQLSRGGWKIHQLPELVEAIREVLRKYDLSPNTATLENIPLSRETVVSNTGEEKAYQSQQDRDLQVPESLYQKILRDLAAVAPPVMQLKLPKKAESENITPDH